MAVTGPFVLQVITPDAKRPSFVFAYDVESRNGRGRVDFTERADAALRFENAGDALRAWRTQSTSTPTRPDGKPNRPLTAYTIAVISLAEALAAEAAAAAD